MEVLIFGLCIKGEFRRVQKSSVLINQPNTMPITTPDKPGLAASNGNLNETARQRYIRLLRILAEYDIANFSTPAVPAKDLLALNALLSENFISGGLSKNSDGFPVNFSGVSITIKGMLFLEDMEQREEAKTSIGLVKQNRFAIYKWVFGIIAGVIVGYLLASIK